MDIYEHGIAREVPVEGSQLRLLATTTAFPVYSGYTYAVVDFAGASLSERGVHVAPVTKACCTADYYEEADLRYCTRALLYHLDRLIDLYVRVSQIFEDNHKTITRGNTGDPRVFFEIEAFFDSARRLYETIRKVLWKHYGRGNDRWSSVFTIPKMPHLVPAAFKKELEASFTAFGNTFTGYRDAAAHNDSVNDGGTTCWTEGYEGRWGVSVKLPENPRAKSRRDYRFENGPEALTYCHEVACHLVELSEKLCDLPKIKHHLDHPEEGDAWVRSLHEAEKRKLG